MYVFYNLFVTIPSDMLQVFRCLVLWSHDPNLDDALKLAKSILIPIDVLNALWPCPGKFYYSLSNGNRVLVGLVVAGGGFSG